MLMLLLQRETSCCMCIVIFATCNLSCFCALCWPSCVAYVQEVLGPVPEGFEMYFRRRFPFLLLEVYRVLHKHCLHDPTFQKYFFPSHQGLL